MNARRSDRNSDQRPAFDCRLSSSASVVWLYRARCAAIVSVVSISTLLSGCAAFRPMDGVPARYLPNELRGCSKESMQMIDLSLLRRRPEAEYRVDSGDVLAIYIENILGRADQPPINQQVASTTSQLNGERPPTLGYPLTVRDDGTIAIPRFGPIVVRGRTIPEVENLVRSAFTQQQRYLTPLTQNRVVVSLHQPRQYRVLVFRQDSATAGALPTIDISNGQIGNSNRGNGKVVALPSGKNDVLHALVESGGLPGLDARDTIWVIRSKQTPRPINQVAYNGIPQQGVPHSNYPPQQMMPGGIPLQPRMPVHPMPGPQPMQLQPGLPGATLPGHSGGPIAPGSGIPHSGHGPIQQTGYWSAQTPRQFAENPTGSPLPLREQPGPTAFGPQSVNDSAPNGVFPAGFQSSQTGSPMSPGLLRSGTGFGQPLIPPGQMMVPQQPFVPGPQMMAGPQMMPGSPMMPGPWLPPAAWNQVANMDPQGLCNLGRTTRIPLRVADCSALNITERDVYLNDGDIIFIQSRENEVFYTGGLLGGGQYNLPRDHDIDILEAISISQGRNQGQDLGKSSLNNDVTISASQAIILRKLPNGSQVPILIDLYRARKYRAERMLIQPGDYIVLQYTKLEAIGAFFERHLLESALFGVAAAQLSTGRR